MVCFGSDLKGHLVPAPCHGQGHVPLDQADESSTQLGTNSGLNPSLMESSKAPISACSHPLAQDSCLKSFWFGSPKRSNIFPAPFRMSQLWWHFSLGFVHVPSRPVRPIHGQWAPVLQPTPPQQANPQLSVLLFSQKGRTSPAPGESCDHEGGRRGRWLFIFHTLRIAFPG